MKIKTKHAKNCVTSTVNLASHKELILKPPKKSQIKAMEAKKIHMERHYEGSHILFLETRAQSMSLQICSSFFTIYGGFNTC